MSAKSKANQSLSSPILILWANKKNSSSLTSSLSSLSLKSSETSTISASSISFQSSTTAASEALNKQITALSNLKATGLLKAENSKELSGAIVNIANCVVVAADNRRRTDAIQSCLTLDSLKEQLDIRGYQLSRTATYYRLLPKNSRTIDVYGACLINEQRVSYSRPTFVAVRYVLPYNYYGNDLDESGKTIDDALELPNFQRPDDAEVVNEPENLLWSSEHIRQSQYLLQIVRCNNNKCCKPWRSYYFQIINQRFIPSPLAFHMSKLGPIPLPFDQKHSKFFHFI
ncbi:unnamed protein product [Rotaria sp. Silwood2]|nr:unnamed protein product [Rotaria sp. Silwood2]